MWIQLYSTSRATRNPSHIKQTIFPDHGQALQQTYIGCKHQSLIQHSDSNILQPSFFHPSNPSVSSFGFAPGPHLTHDHRIPRHTTHDYQRHLEQRSHAPQPSPAPIALILPGIPNRIRHPARAPCRSDASADDGI